MSLLLRWFLSVCSIWCLGLSGCTGSSDSAEVMADERVEFVSVGFGGSSPNVRGAIQSNSMEVKSLVIQTQPKCGGALVQIVSSLNPATGIPVCKTGMEQSLKLLKVDLEIKSGATQESRLYSLDLSQPELFPAQLSLQKTQTGNQIAYQVTDKGGAVVSQVSLISYFVSASLAVTYIDNHFLEEIGYESLSDTLVKATFMDCQNCTVYLGESTFPSGIRAYQVLSGAIILDTEQALNGIHQVNLAVSRDSQSIERTRVYLNISVQRIAEPSPTPSPPIIPTATPSPLASVTPIVEYSVWNCSITYYCFPDNGGLDLIRKSKEVCDYTEGGAESKSGYNNLLFQSNLCTDPKKAEGIDVVCDRLGPCNQGG